MPVKRLPRSPSECRAKPPGGPILRPSSVPHLMVLKSGHPCERLSMSGLYTPHRKCTGRRATLVRTVRTVQRLRSCPLPTKKHVINISRYKEQSCGAIAHGPLSSCIATTGWEKPAVATRCGRPCSANSSARRPRIRLRNEAVDRIVGAWFDITQACSVPEDLSAAQVELFQSAADLLAEGFLLRKGVKLSATATVATATFAHALQKRRHSGTVIDYFSDIQESQTAKDAPLGGCYRRQP